MLTRKIRLIPRWAEVALLVLSLGVFLAILVPNWIRARSQGPYTCRSSLKTIGTEMEMYEQDNHAFPPRLQALVPKYLRTLPTCPQAGRDTYSDSYTLSSDRKAYTVSCLGHWHADVGMAADYPQYSSRVGFVEKTLSPP